MKNKIIIFVLLLAIFCLALFLRVYFSKDAVLSSPIKYSTDDGVYHMRLVENELLGGHFPYRIYFDPFTYFPYGTYIHFTPLYDQLLCLIIWIISLGKPTLEIINKVAPFYPAVMGSLVIFFVYFIAKKIWDRKIALFSAFLSAILSQFLWRSLLGNTDHHVGEVFFSTLTILFFVYLISGRKEGLISNIKDKKFWIYTILTGVSLGLYFLTWTGALLFLVIFACFIFFYYLIKYLLGKKEDWILFAGGVIFCIAFSMIAPFFGHPDILNSRMYNIQHIVLFALSVLSFVIVGLCGDYLFRKNKKPYYLLLSLLGFFFLFIVIIKLIFPFIWQIVINTALEVNFGIAFVKEARNGTGEMSPLRISGGFNAFSALFYLSIISLFVVLYKFIKEKRAELFFLFVWSSLILFVSGVIQAFGQNRNVYYLAIVISLLSGFIIVRGLEFGWGARIKSREFEVGTPVHSYLYIGSILIISIVLFLFLFPFPFNIDNKYPGNLPDIFQSAIGNARPSVASEDWYDTLAWLRTNTPDPGLDYNAIYEEPKVNKETGKINPYNYPPQAYGILAKWDAGHMITYYSHRIPVANPFQEGVGYINNGQVEAGEGTFFLETDEKKATGYLDELRAKYIVVDNLLSNMNGVFRGYAKWINVNMEDYTGDNISETEPTKFDLAMSTRLYFLDGSAVSFPKIVDDKKISLNIPALNHFRLLYESKNDTSIFWGKEYKTTKQVKVFQYVPGAIIRGYTSPGTLVSVSSNITTNQKREFVYEKSVIADKNGLFEFVVPYCTSEQKMSDVSSDGYMIKTQYRQTKVVVSEEDISQGKTITVY